VLQRFAQEIKPLFEACHDSGVYFERLRDLLKSLIAKLETIPDDDKTPKEVVKLENYYTLQDFLRWYKAPALAELTQQAKANYQFNLDLYVNSYVGFPVQALKSFLDEVQSRIDNGAKAEEIKFVQAFATQELKKHVQATTPKEVEKGVKALYQRVSKHLSSDAAESMVSVVWGEMQRTFLENHKRHTDLLHTCYGPSLHTLYSDKDIHDAFDRAVRDT
jgi:predicted metal-dependent enzyme (double-stranded beta helix superfamily)